MSITEEQLEQLKNDFVAVYKPKGSIGSDTLCDKLEKIDIDSSQMEEIYKVLEDNGIRIVDDYEKDKELYDQLLKEISMDDPVKMYLKDIGKVPLLSADDEIDHPNERSSGK